MTDFQLKIPSLIDNIRIVESFIDQARERFRFDDDIYGNIIVAVTESVNNAIIHGNRSNKEKDVLLKIEADNSNISFTVEDEGDGFDFHNLPDPTSPENINKPGGRGIFLIRHLADEVKFHNEGTTIEMIFYLNS
ncbi:ATP-binding protein [Rapidithrix thailandica]|uniref:ATP-binding protein n=1 Tax=Rapidithrix thailandica TaxID=413964 RepID=A0AAW9S9X6_9BACT